MGFLLFLCLTQFFCRNFLKFLDFSYDTGIINSVMETCGVLYDKFIFWGSFFMFCSKCGKQLSDGNKFCIHCGALNGWDDAPGSAPVAEERGKLAAAIIAGAVVLIVMVVVGGISVYRDLTAYNAYMSDVPPAEENPDEFWSAENDQTLQLEPDAELEPVSVRLVSTDASSYPLVRAYFRVERGDGEVADGLDRQSFIIQERLQGGEYLSREVRAVSTMESRGVNIDLVADKSSSISEADMRKIKQVMIEFVNSLRYEVGDKAEILAFDDIVQQMCYYTNDSSLLVNGINNMATDGNTALYTALYNGILNASLQGGARCVVAFTDGEDNRSFPLTPGEVIDYANTNQVPVYIIGVGEAVLDYGELSNIAQSTGGRYWYIDDLYNLQEIFDDIYKEQKELYMVEYVSDAAAGQYDVRDIVAKVSGCGYSGETQTSFRPVRSVQTLTHTSRYELVKEALTWEEAARRCQEMGGHLATITSRDEMDKIISLAEANDVKYIWLGGYTSYDSYGNVFGHWVTGEDFSFQAWSAKEPSRVDLDGMPEWYIMLWNIEAFGGWCWNDQRNDPLSVAAQMAPNMGFVCEFEN